MTLFRPFPIDKAWPNAIDLRKAFSGLITREGVFPDPTSVADAGLAYGISAWSVGSRAFTFASKRGGAPYSQGYGVALGGDDATGAAWTLGGAPGSGTRIDRLWVRLVDPTQGESLTTPGGETVARAVPVYGITPGTPGLAALPAGAVEIAQASVPAGAASVSGVTFAQTYKFAQVSGGIIYVRTNAERDALTGLVDGDTCFVIGTGQLFRYLAKNAPTSGWYHDGGRPATSALTLGGLWGTAPGAIAPRAAMQGGRVYLDGSIVNTTVVDVALGTEYQIATIADAAFRPTVTSYFATGTQSAATAGIIRVASDGGVWWRANASANWPTGAPLRIDFGGINYPIKGLV